DPTGRPGTHPGAAGRRHRRLRRRDGRTLVPRPRHRTRCRDHRHPPAGRQPALHPPGGGGEGHRHRPRRTAERMILSTCDTPVREDWIDYNGHLSEAYYVLVFGFATDTAMDALGLGAG